MDVTTLVFIDATGYHTSDFPTWLQFVQDGFRGIYGADVYLGSDSQDGQWTSLLAQAFFDMQNVGASTYNSFSPATAKGIGLSRIVKINGIAREVPTFSTVDLTIGGVFGTVLTGAVAVDSLNQKWNIPTTTIPFAGTILVTATSAVEGAIAAPPNTINMIFTPTQGWQTVNNPLAAILGAPVETDAALRARQAFSTANPSLTVFEGTEGAVGNVPGVSASQGYENPTGATDGNGLPPHSIAMVVEGGNDVDIATAIQIHKTPGTQTIGTTIVPVFDSRGMPINIHFYRPIPATINVQVTITPLTGYSPNYAAQIITAVSAAVIPPVVTIGGTVVLSKLYIAAYLIGTPAFGTYNIVNIEISKDLDPLGTADVALLFDEISMANVTVIT